MYPKRKCTCGIEKTGCGGNHSDWCDTQKGPTVPTKKMIWEIEPMPSLFGPPITDEEIDALFADDDKTTYNTLGNFKP